MTGKARMLGADTRLGEGGAFTNILQKNPNELFGQLNNMGPFP